MIYDQSKLPSLSPELFRSPTSDYRSAPFWAWNGELTPEECRRQIGVFRQMGFGGFHMHARAGLITPYLSDAYMECVRVCCEEARKEGMLAWLYDEDRYPSGPAGGIVTENPAFTRRFLRLTPFPNGDPRAEKARRGYPRMENSHLLAVYDVVLDEKDRL